MATCEDLATQRGNLSGQVQALNTQISNTQGNIDANWPGALAADTFAGDLPTQDVNSISNRCVTICEEATQDQLGLADGVISNYQGIVSMIEQKTSFQSQLPGLQNQLTSVVLQQLNQGCLN